jgi:glycerol-3-phosphate dehydrogenase
MEALKERGILRRNAPHLVHDLAFVVPNYAWWETPFYGIGMKVYDMLAGKYGFGKSRLLSKEEVLERIPTLEQQGLRGGVLYYDGQFDDARLLIDLAHTADGLGAVLLNYAKVVGFSHDPDGFIDGLTFEDAQSGRIHAIRAHCVINATGAFSDAVRRLDEPDAPAMIAPSQGIHLVLDRSFLPGDAAIMVPRTSDGRVMFAIPWYGRTLLGTTDTPISHVSIEPQATRQEIDFILETAAGYLSRDPTRSDVLCVFAGIRPLVKSAFPSSSAALSREHTIHVSKSGLLSIAGGKWTTYRKMAEDCVDHAATLARLEERVCVTRTLPIHGCCEDSDEFGDLHYYGAGASAIQQLIASNADLGKPLHPRLPICEAQVIHAARQEMACTVDDVLARRTRCLFLDAKAAGEAATVVAQLLARELGRDGEWITAQTGAFRAIVDRHVIDPA